MKSYRNALLSGTVVPLAIGAGIGLASFATVSGPAPATEPTAAYGGGATARPSAAVPLPQAVPRAVQVAACNPCAANPCNPCGAKNPCAAANPCNPCNPCAGATSAASSRCVVPRLAAANPCAAKNPCAANPCNPCNPCAGKNPCNPCGAKNPCGAANPCNPCAAKNPCAAANPCNPCAAANPCNPCNPCGAGAAVELTEAEAVKAYDCILPELQEAYRKSGHSAAMNYGSWRRYSRIAYTSATHGNRFVNNYANDEARAYAGFEKAGTMPEGAMLAKDSFSVSKAGAVGVGPLFLMEKMGTGFNKASGDWRYTMIMPDGSTFGVTKGKNSAGMQFCAQCHAAVGDTQDHMFFLPSEYRVK